MFTGSVITLGIFIGLALTFMGVSLPMFNRKSYTFCLTTLIVVAGMTGLLANAWTMTPFNVTMITQAVMYVATAVVGISAMIGCIVYWAFIMNKIEQASE